MVPLHFFDNHITSYVVHLMTVDAAKQKEKVVAHGVGVVISADVLGDHRLQARVRKKLIEIDEFGDRANLAR